MPVVIYTDGLSSSVRERLNAGKPCEKYPGEHSYNLYEQEFIWAIDDEFVATCIALGVKRGDIYTTSNYGKDGGWMWLRKL